MLVSCLQRLKATCASTCEGPCLPCFNPSALRLTPSAQRKRAAHGCQSFGFSAEGVATGSVLGSCSCEAASATTGCAGKHILVPSHCWPHQQKPSALIRQVPVPQQRISSSMVLLMLLVVLRRFGLGTCRLCLCKKSRRRRLCRFQKTAPERSLRQHKF